MSHAANSNQPFPEGRSMKSKCRAYAALPKSVHTSKSAPKPGYRFMRAASCRLRTVIEVFPWLSIWHKSIRRRQGTDRRIDRTGESHRWTCEQVVPEFLCVSDSADSKLERGKCILTGRVDEFARL